MKRLTIVFIILIVFSIGIFLIKKTNEPSGVVISKPNSKLVKPPAETSLTQNVQAQTESLHKQTISPEEIETFRQRLATKEEVRKEMNANPHGAPRAIIYFAETLGIVMEKGLNNVSDATILIDELYGCAINASLDVTIRALCVSNAEKLSQPHPELKAESEKIRDAVSEDILEMADARKVKIQNKND